MVKNLREKVSWCQREHPVTHYYDCADIVGQYLKLVKVRRMEGRRAKRRKGENKRFMHAVRLKAMRLLSHSHVRNAGQGYARLERLIFPFPPTPIHPLSL